MKRQANHHAFSIEETSSKRINQCFKTRNCTRLCCRKDKFNKKSMRPTYAVGSSCLTRIFFIFRSKSLLGIITLCPHPSHLMRISMPKRMTFHRLAPHGWGFFISTTSCNPNALSAISLHLSCSLHCIYCTKKLRWRAMYKTKSLFQPFTLFFYIEKTLLLDHFICDQ